MRALILAAGLGTRLRPLTYVRAKAAAPVNGQALVRRVISWLVTQGLRDIVLNLHHLPASIAAVVGDGQDLGARVRYSWEDSVLGSAGGPRHALPLLVDGLPSGEQRFVLVNGDTLTDVSLPHMLAEHAASGALVTLAVIRNPKPELYGGVRVENGRVVGFTRRGAAGNTFHFIGVQVAEARAFAALQDGVPAESVTSLYTGLIQNDPSAIRAHLADASFHDIGTPADYLQTSLDLAAEEGDRLVSGTGTEIDATATLRRTAVWDEVVIGAGAHLDECVVCDGVHLPAHSRYERSAIVRHRGESLQPGDRVERDLLIRNL